MVNGLLLLGLGLLKNIPSFIEITYTRFLYPLLYSGRAWFFNLLPFSLGDLFYLLLFFVAVYQLFQLKLADWKKTLISFLSILSLLFLWFQLSWGMNYHRKPLTEKLPGENHYTLKELTDLTVYLAHKANELHLELSTEDHLEVTYQLSRQAIIEQIETQAPVSSIQGKAKISHYSLPLTYMGFSGYLNPFTLEAQVNGRIPKLNIPVTAAHEIAHQQGYAAENEANFIAFLHTYNHPNKKIKYAAVLFAFKYAFNELVNIDIEKAQELKCLLYPGIIANYAATSRFWKQFQNPFEPYFKKSYDAYLKANDQAKGIQSYNEVTLLLIKGFKLNPTFKISINNL